MGERRCRWRVDPAQVTRVAHARDREFEGEGGEVGLEDLCTGARWQRRVLVFRPEPVADARCHAPGAARPLRGRGLRHADRRQARHPGTRIEAGHARETGVHHRAHPLDRQAGLRDRRGEHHLPGSGGRGRERLVLHRLPHGTEQRVHPCLAWQVVQEPSRSADLGGARQEDEHVARFAGQRVANRARRHALGGLAGTGRLPADLHRIRPPLAGDHRRIVEQGGDRGAVECGRHHEQPEVGAQERARLQHEGEAEVGVQRALVELIEDDESVCLERGIVLDKPRQHSFRHHLDARARRHAGVEPHAVSDSGADRLRQHRGHPLCRCARGQTPRLQQRDSAAGEPGLVQQSERYVRSLSSPGRSRQHRSAIRVQHTAQLRERGVHRKLVVVGGTAGAHERLDVGGRSDGGVAQESLTPVRAAPRPDERPIPNGLQRYHLGR